MKLKGTENQSWIERYLKKHKRERKRLGLPRVPDQTSINVFERDHMTDEIEEILSFIENKIIQIAKDFNIDLDNKQQKKKAWGGTMETEYSDIMFISKEDTPHILR